MRDFRLEAAVRGDLEAFMREELLTAERAVTHGVKDTTDDVKHALRRDVIRGNLGTRLARSWRSRTYPQNGTSLEAAGLVWTKAEDLISAFDRGVRIRSKEGFWLAIPTPAAPKRGKGGKRLTPSNFPENRFGPLRFVYRRSGVSLLVVDNQRLSRGKRGGYVRSRSKRALATGNGLSTVPMFFLVPQVRLRK
ncbi:MAG: DUF6441 family protein, partial [Pseudomonadota bacterium]